MYWGLDPMHRAYVKMFVRDVLEMDAYPGHPAMNVFAYRNHPISRVDLLGWVVRVEERDKLFNYAIDDGTGVISCTCWKPRVQSTLSTTGEESMDDADYSTTGASTSADSAEQEFAEFLALKRREIKKCLRQLKQPARLGDLLHVRGRIKSYRGRREIGAAYFRHVDDPTCSIEINRTMEQLQLYRDFYDVPFQRGNGDGGDCTGAGVVKSLQDAIADFLNTSSTVLNFEIKELATVDSLMAVVEKARKENESAMTAKQVNSLFTQAVGGLEDLGLVYKRTDKDNLYVVVDRDDTLESNVLEIVRQESQNPKYSESGCHYRHVLDCLRTSHRFSGVGPNVVVYILDKLESQSDVISTSENYYIAF